MIDVLDTFLREALGLSYGLSGGKLMKQKTTIKSTTDENELIDADRTFFCSELVAKAFKLLGIIENDETSCTQFLPHHFSSRGGDFLKCTPGTKINDEMHIIMNHGDF